MQHDDLQTALGGRCFRYFPSVGSTMDEARAWLRHEPNLVDGAVVIADEQRQGQGRRGRGWLTPPGAAVALSLIWRDVRPPWTMIGALAIADALAEYVSPSLKWPNDVLVEGRKIAGVLAQRDEQVVILGLGINLRVDFRNTPLHGIATSLSEHTSLAIHRPAFIAELLARMDYWIARHEAHHILSDDPAIPSPVFTAWQDRLTMLGQPVQVVAGDQTIQGIAVEVAPDGALVVENEAGRHHFLAGDVTLKAPLR